eukprot:GHVN01066149.1.p1 GENE.GHVN01066149.1~~GHVN01066149.1.p1  ORF type:complete len:272 (+),score=29.31 GHVN01066149.1:433-1248(+)
MLVVLFHISWCVTKASYGLLLWTVGVRGTQWQAVNNRGRADTYLLQPLRFVTRFIGVAEIMLTHMVQISEYVLCVNGVTGLVAGVVGAIGVLFNLKLFVALFGIMVACIYAMQTIMCIVIPFLITQSEYYAIISAAKRGWDATKKVAELAYWTPHNVITIAGVFFTLATMIGYFVIGGFFLVEMVWSLYNVMELGGNGAEFLAPKELAHIRHQQMKKVMLREIRDGADDQSTDGEEDFQDDEDKTSQREGLDVIEPLLSSRDIPKENSRPS